jgi:hypothetical protein
LRNKEAIMDIIILKQEIFNEVEKRSSLEGYAIPDRYDQVWANSSRGELLDSYWIEGYTAVVQLLKKYLSSDSVAYTLNSFNEGEKLTISVEMPSRYDDKLNGSISTDVKMLIACNIITGWLKVVLPEAASKYEEESKGYSEDLRVKLLYRKSPEDTLNNPKSDSDNISSGSEAELSEAKSDSVTIGGSEAELSEAKIDSVAIVESQEALRKANEDDVVLVQGWNYRQCCRTTDCVLLVNR